jgi:hypothetical protein
METSRMLLRTFLTLIMTGLPVASASARWNSRSARLEKFIFGGKFAPRRPGTAKNLIVELPENLAAEALLFDGF